jgi:hypothetical protein
LKLRKEADERARIKKEKEKQEELEQELHTEWIRKNN